MSRHATLRHVHLPADQLDGWLRADARPTLGPHQGHARLRGPFSAAGSVVRSIVPALMAERPELARRYDLEILTAAPELSAVLTNSRTTLTSEAAPSTRTRYYPHNRVIWIGNGLTDLLLAATGAGPRGQRLVVTGADQLDPTDNVWLAGLLRRADPGHLQVVLVSSGGPVAEPLATALTRHADHPTVRRPASPADRTAGATDATGGPEAARRYVASACLADEPGWRAAYEALPEADRRALHDAEADRLEARGEPSLLLGAVPFHRERGGDPERAVAAAEAAQATCLLAGFYDRLVELGAQVRSMLSWERDPERKWLATVKMTISLQAMGRPDEAMALFDDACANSTLPSVHMQSAYGRAMVYTRYYDEDRRDLVKARGLINTAVVLAGLASTDERRAYNRTFNENGLALVDMHLGHLSEAAEMVEHGIARLDAEVANSQTLLHRAVLRYNHAQLMVRLGRTDQALAEYGQIIADDPNHPDYYFDRARLFGAAGRDDEAMADYTAAARVGPPYPEPYYNRGEILMRQGHTEAAVADFTRVLELDPAFVDAWVNRAALHLELGDTAAAERDVLQGLELAPADPHLHCLRGQLEAEAGRAAEARRWFESALELDPGLAGAWANLGVVLFDQGLADESCRCFEQALELDDDPAVRQNLMLAQAAA